MTAEKKTEGKKEKSPKSLKNNQNWLSLRADRNKTNQIFPTNSLCCCYVMSILPDFVYNQFTGKKDRQSPLTLRRIT